MSGMKKRAIRELTNAAARLSLRYGVTVEGPSGRDSEPHRKGGESYGSVRLWVLGTDGLGLLLTAGPGNGSDVSIDAATIREDVDARGGYRIDFTLGVTERVERISVEGERAGEIIEGLMAVDCADLVDGYQIGECPRCDKRAGRDDSLVRSGNGENVTTSGIPFRYRADDNLSNAWEHGKDGAERDYAHSEAYGESFPAEPTEIPAIYRGDAETTEAFRDGYATRAQYLIDGES